MTLQLNDNSTVFMRNHVRLRLVTSNLCNRHSYPGRKALLPMHLMQIIDFLNKTKDSYVKVTGRKTTPIHLSAPDVRHKLANLPFLKNFTRALAKIIMKRSAR